MDVLQVTIDGEKHGFDTPVTMLQAVRRVGADVPTVCFDPRLKPTGTCRLCCVEVEGQPHPQIACRTPIEDGMRITTQSSALETFRRTELTWLANHVAPVVAAAEPQKELHQLLRKYGIAPAQHRKSRRQLDTTHPYIRVDMSQCVTCYRCVHICEDLQGQFVWHVLDKGDDIKIVPDSNTTLIESSCVSCGACVDTCPTGALTDSGRVRNLAIDLWTRTTCVYCGVGCEMEVASAAGKIVRAKPCNDAPVSKGHLCVKGRYAFSFTNSSDRKTHPMARDGAGWKRLSWEGALYRTASTLKKISSTYGPDSIGILASARATNEENYLIQKFARVVIGTNNVDSCARVCHTPTAAAMKAMLGTGAATNSFDDIEEARTLFVFGANPLENHPIVGARIRQCVLRGKASLIVVDPRKTELARIATIHLALRPGTNVPLLNAMANVIVMEGLVDQHFLDERVSDWKQFETFIKSWSVERAAALCGLSPTDIRAAARLYATSKPAMTFHGLGVTEHVQGTEGVMALVNLALLTGNIGKPGSGMNPLRGQNNVQGAAHMGCDPAILTGSVAIDANRARFEEIWDAPIPRSRGLHVLGMMDAALAGRLKALFVVGYDVLPTLANSVTTRQALRNLEFVVAQDLFLTKTARVAADVFFPAASVFEKDGTFMNSERRIQRIRKAVEPRGNAWPDWKIIATLADRMGHGHQFRYQSAEDIWNEVRQVWPEGAGITYGRIEQGGLQWPCLHENDPGTAILHVAQFGAMKRAPLQRIDYHPTPEQVSLELPLLLTTGRNLYQFNSGTMTGRTANTKLRPTDTLDVSPEDAA